MNLTHSRHLHPNFHRLRSQHQLYRLWLHKKKQNRPEKARKTPNSQQCGRISQWSRNNQTLSHPLHSNGRNCPQGRILCYQMQKRQHHPRTTLVKPSKPNNQLDQQTCQHPRSNWPNRRIQSSNFQRTLHHQKSHPRTTDTPQAPTLGTWERRTHLPRWKLRKLC